MALARGWPPGLLTGPAARVILENLGVAAGYFLAARLGVLVAVGPASVSPLWPAAGVALAAVLLRGPRVLPGVALAVFANAALVLGQHPAGPVAAWGALAALLAAGASFEAFFGAWLVRRYGGSGPLLDRIYGVVALLVLGAILSPLPEAGLAVAVLAAAGLIPGADILTTFGAWWLGDMTGIAVAAPAILSLAQSRKPPARPDPGRLLFFGLLIVAYSHLAFRGTDIAGFTVMPYLAFPLLMWAVVWFGKRTATWSFLLVGTIAAWHTVRGSGPYAQGTFLDSIVVLDTFLGVAVVSTLMLGAALTERDTANREARERERLFQAFMRYSPVGAFIKDDAGRFVFANRRTEEVLALRPGQWEGKTASELFTEVMAREIDAFERQVLETGQPSDLVGVGGPDAAATHWLVNLFPIEIHGKKQVGGFAADITEIAKAQEGLEEANRKLREADRYKDEFLALLSHELKTPLNLVSGFAGILTDELDGPLNQRQHDRVKEIERAAERMLALVQDLVDSARIMSGKLHPEIQREDFAPILRGVVTAMRPLAEVKRVNLDAHVQVGLAADVDGPLIYKAIAKLLSNAVKFTESGGQVALRAYRSDAGVTVVVEDTGPGIPEQDLPYLFTRQPQGDVPSTRPSGGLGLDLLIAKGIVEAHGGTIGVLCKKEAGCRLWLTLPDRLVGPGGQGLSGDSVEKRPVV